MAHAVDTARAILTNLTQAQSVGRSPVAIVLDESTRDGLQRAGLGYWSAGRATWSLFNVPVVVGSASGWRLRFEAEAEPVAA